MERQTADAAPEAAEAAADEGPLQFERVVFFSDAVFAIVITLLVLPLTELDLPEGGDLLGSVLEESWPRALTFAVSFLVVGQFWFAHHRMFGHLRRGDPGLLWFNLVALLTVSFMPFPTAVLGAHASGHDRFPVVFYAASLTAASIALTATWLYSLRKGLVDPGEDPDEVRAFTVRSFVTVGVFALSVVAALTGLAVAVAFWVVVLPLARLLVTSRGNGRAAAAGGQNRSG